MNPAERFSPLSPTVPLQKPVGLRFRRLAVRCCGGSTIAYVWEQQLLNTRVPTITSAH
ncbi:hypothetical protein LPU83_pLPU83d_0694 (plasmid) [Rhizobium favelukesii]|uniref:Uncharacterized protein n=1 Tax=Rhizobium favelukesii TaxID=348824 RepID=W6RMR0_9HYPH|nr:hypothetical protein LPU83_pLPU83d_0694 [Rhizobium favelukesii]